MDRWRFWQQNIPEKAQVRLVSEHLIMFVSVLINVLQSYLRLDFITCLSRALMDFIYDVCSHMFITCCSRVYHVLVVVACVSCVVMNYIKCCGRMLFTSVMTVVVVDFITCRSYMFITNTSSVFPRVPTSPRGTRKKIQQTQQVTMPTGSRSLDKRTLASLVVVRHLGDTDRRNM